MDEFVPYYPAFLSLRHRLVVIIGGGAVAERRVRGMVKYQADILVVSPEITPRLEELEEECAITVEHRGYVRGDLQGAAVVISATHDAEVDRAVFEEAEERGCLVNVTDDPGLCNFIAPSVIHRGPFQIAISTAGAAPFVAKRVRKQLAEEFGDEWDEYITLLGQVRTLVSARVQDPAERTRMFEAMADSGLIDRIRLGVHPIPEDVFAEFSQQPADEEEGEGS
jgi:precorrin-2 dehydrogenase/sirohydrochlorin ferrochelatase